MVITENLVSKRDKCYKVVEALCSAIPECLELYVCGKVSDAYQKLNKALDDLWKEIDSCKNSLWIKDITDIEGPSTHRTFYRSRNDIRTNNVNDLKHIPFNQLYKTFSQRFTISGCADLYLSYTKEACEREIGNNGTIAEYKLKDAESVKVFDMSAFELNSNKGANVFLKEKNNEQLIAIWPLIAACNSIAYIAPGKKNECKNINRTFKIEYVIPQMFAAYLKSKDIAGLRYYTVRDEDLDPSRTDMMDIVLFTKYSSEHSHDDVLLNKFEISIIKK